MISIKEQTQLLDNHIDELRLHDIYGTMTADKLGLGRAEDGRWWSSYYIGLTEVNGQYIEVLPKIENLDFMSLFSYALMYQPSSDYFSRCYDINWEKEVYASTMIYDVLTPLLVMQYLTVLDKLVGRGLKRDYITYEENLHSKIKGKLKPIAHWRNNIIKKKEDYFYCKYQEYSSDIPVNRLLKKALNISLQLLGNVRSQSSNMKAVSFLSSKLKLVEAFKNISGQVYPESVKTYKFNKLNTYYPEAITLAKCIIRHEENALNSNDKQKKVPLFWIDMSRLYEVYVLGILQSTYPSKIRFQQMGSYRTQCDYVHIGEGIVLDAKYKLWYSSDGGRISHSDSMVADVREISGYARDERILRLMEGDVQSPACIIIHPDENDADLKTSLLESAKSNVIEGYRDFYRLGISLPRFKK